MKNSLSLKLTPLHRLKLGQSTLVGPYLEAKTVGAAICRVRQREGCESWSFSQRQVLLCDPTHGLCHKMYLVKRVG